MILNNLSVKSSFVQLTKRNILTKQFFSVDYIIEYQGRFNSI